MKIILKLICLLVIISITLLYVKVVKVSACSPAGPDQWFNTEITFDKSALPIGVEIIKSNINDNTDLIVNRNSEPFYIVEKIDPQLLSPAYGNEYRYPNSELPEIYKPIYKIVNSQVYSWGTYDSREPKSWLLDNIAGVDLLQIFTADRETSYENQKQVYRDNRPSVVDIPLPDNVTFLGYFNINPIEFKGLRNYILNDKYNPTIGAKSAEACNNWETIARSNNSNVSIGSIVSLVINIAMLLMAGFLTYKLINLVRR